MNCSVTVNGIGLGDSAVVTLSQTHDANTTVTNFPASLTVTGLSRTFTFQVQTPPGSCIFHAGPPPYYDHVPGPGGSMTVTATCNGVTGTALLAIQGYPAPVSCP